MSIEQLKDALDEVRKTDVTKTIHTRPYDAISPTRPELSQARRTILITGGGTGTGFALAQAFIRALAATIIIIGRRGDVLEKARVQLEEDVKAAGTGAKVIAQTCDTTNMADIEALWKGFEEKGVYVDTYVANAAKFTEPKRMLELGADEVWSQVETNVKGPLYIAEKFMAQKVPGGGEKQKFIVNISTGSVHGHAHPQVIIRPAYTLSKLSSTLLFQLLASDYPHDKVQVISFHPGLVYSEAWKDVGVEPEFFDSTELAGNFAVWTASKEAAFLHGRMVWCSWDVEEMAGAEFRKQLGEDPYFLRASIAGLRFGMKA